MKKSMFGVLFSISFLLSISPLLLTQYFENRPVAFAFSKPLKTVEKKAQRTKVIDLFKPSHSVFVHRHGFTKNLFIMRNKKNDRNQSLVRTKKLPSKKSNGKKISITPFPSYFHGYYTGNKAFASVRYWIPTIRKYASQYGVSSSLIASMMLNESGGNPYAISSESAYGLLQLNASYYNNANQQLFDPITNIKDGIALFAQYLRAFQGNVKDALASYNAGITTVENNGIPSYTLPYINNILADENYF